MQHGCTYIYETVYYQQFSNDVNVDDDEVDVYYFKQFST